MCKRIRVLVVDDHPFFRAGVVQWLNRQQEVVCCGEADSLVSTRKAVAELQPDVVLLDLQLGDGDGLDLAAELSESHPAVRIMVVSQRDEGVYAHRALRAGARGYLMKSEATHTVLTAIQKVWNGEIYVSRAVAAEALHNLFPDPSSPHPQLSRLTDRELQVFQLLGSGYANRNVAATLRISTKTVETYRENLKHKLRLPDSDALIRVATDWVKDGKFPS